MPTIRRIALPGAPDTVFQLGFLILAAYAWLASVLPVWVLLQPRDYVANWVLIIGIALGAAGLAISGLPITAPAFTGFVNPQHGPLIPMLGGGQSLSAGIVYAHFKDHLGRLVAEAERLVDEEAKDRLGRGAVAFSWRSRGGEKRCFAMKWHGGKNKENTEDHLAEPSWAPVQSWARVVEAFKRGKLPKSLPNVGFTRQRTTYSTSRTTSRLSGLPLTRCASIASRLRRSI